VVYLHDTGTGEQVGVITDDQFQFLVDELEEESLDDQDYYIDLRTLDMFEQHGAEPALLDVLRRALGSRESIEIGWLRS
jgi:processive 1,2-diacylglycerol beta-glucosyltransferase